MHLIQSQLPLLRMYPSLVASKIVGRSLLYLAGTNPPQTMDRLHPLRPRIQYATLTTARTAAGSQRRSRMHSARSEREMNRAALRCWSTAVR
jgi:hypothetical protein